VLENSIYIPDVSTITVVEGFRSRHRRRLDAITGQHETLVVRVTINDIGPNPLSDALAGSVFGLGGNVPDQTMTGQYNACSFGKLQFYPASGTNIWNGVVDISISGDELKILSLISQGTLSDAVKAIIPSGVSPEHIMYVLPYGTQFPKNAAGTEFTTNWVAFAYVGGYTSYYNDKWGDYLSSQMHEVGHNLGFHHSSEGSVQYGDKTGLMGYR
jgi:hypothetical protein